MSKIKSYRDIDHKLELIEVQKSVNLDKLRGGIQKTKSSIYPSLLSFSIKKIFGKKKKKNKKD